MFRTLVLMLLAMGTSAGYAQSHTQNEEMNRPHDCGFQPSDQILQTLQQAVANGEIPDPKTLELPDVAPRKWPTSVATGGTLPDVTQEDIFYHADVNYLLRSNFSETQLRGMLSNTANEVIAEYGDNFDFVGFFINFAPHHFLGAAFYLPVENDVIGIGDSLYNNRPNYGIAGNQVEGFVMMWNHIGWAPGSNNRTQLVLGQEFEHRFGVFLNPLSGNRRMQGINDSCGRSAHWNFRVDGQGSGMEIGEWVGSSPALRSGEILNVNSDLDSVFSYPDLYIMGYISPDELDTLPSELRYMNDSADCNAPYNGPMTTWDSSDIIAADGVRVPESKFAQKHFHTAWVVIHLPEAPPTSSELDRIVDILNDWKTTWEFGTLGRGTMDNTLDVPFRITFVDAIPIELTPGEDTPIFIRTFDMSDSANESSGILHYSIDGEEYQTVPMVSTTPNIFSATLPALACTNMINFYFTIESDDGRTIQNPRAAPATVYTAIASVSSSLIFEDDFNTDEGWTVMDSVGLTDGTWDRGVPMGVGDRGDPMTDYDGSGSCFLTNSQSGNTDIDDGSSTLLSPIFDLSAESEVIVRYARWYTNDFGSDPFSDAWIVEVTDNGGIWVELEHSNISNAWDTKTFRLGDYVALSDQVQFRFIASDLGLASVVEAALDAFSLTSIDCSGMVCNPSDPVQPDPTGIIKSRFISIVPGNSGLQSAIRVTLKDLDQFSDFNNEVRWVGPPEEFQEGANPVPTFIASRLQCTPHYQDWGDIEILHVYGTSIVPSSVYDVQVVAEYCGISQESYFSTPLTLATGKWCDIVVPFYNGQFQQPDIADVLGVVDKFIGFANPIKALTKVRPKSIDLSNHVGIAEVLDVVDAFLGITYPYGEPDPCP